MADFSCLLELTASRSRHSGRTVLILRWVGPQRCRFLIDWQHVFFCVVTAPSQSQDDEDDTNEKPDPDHLFTVVVSIRSFLKFLNSHVVSTTTIACWFIPCLCDRNDLLIVFLFRHMSKSLHDPLCLYRRRRRRGWGVNVLYSYHRRRRPLVLEIVLRLPLVSLYLFFPSSWVISECCLLSWTDWFCRNMRSFHFWRHVSPYSETKVTTFPHFCSKHEFMNHIYTIYQACYVSQKPMDCRSPLR